MSAKWSAKRVAPWLCCNSPQRKCGRESGGIKKLIPLHFRCVVSITKTRAATCFWKAPIASSVLPQTLKTCQRPIPLRRMGHRCSCETRGRAKSMPWMWTLSLMALFKRKQSLLIPCSFFVPQDTYSWFRAENSREKEHSSSDFLVFFPIRRELERCQSRAVRFSGTRKFDRSMPTNNFPAVMSN